MKTTIFSNIKKRKRTLYAFLLFAVVLLSACSEDDDKKSGTPYFGIEGNPTGLSVDAKISDKNGVSFMKSYVVRSNRPWKIVAQSEGDWTRAFPAEGVDDGIFKMVIKDNTTFVPRTMNFAIVVDGEEQPVFFRVDQKESVPNITIVDKDKGISVPAAGGNATVTIQANVTWEYSLSDDSWLTQKSISTGDITFSAPLNDGGRRSTVLTVYSNEYPALTQQVTITQSPSSIVLEENFNWLNYGNAIPYETAGEQRFDLWTQAEKDHGWSSDEVTGTERLCYARVGFVKLGKTNYAGSLITPKLSSIEGTQNVKVTFKAAGYISGGSTTANGSKDDNLLKIVIKDGGVASVTEFTINNFPNDKKAEAEAVVNDIWAADKAYTFTITGATNQTTIKFIAGDVPTLTNFNITGVKQGKNRIFMDDIKVEIIP